MTQPTLVAVVASDFTASGSTGRPLVSSLTWSTGDEFFALGMSEDQGATFTAPTVTGLTFTLTGAGIPTSTSNSCKGYLWRATAGSSGSGTPTATISSAGAKGGIIIGQFSGCGGLGNIGVLTSTADTVSLIRSGANSHVMVIAGDWGANAVGSSTFTPAGSTTDVRVTDAGSATFFGAHWGDQGSAGTTSYGVATFTSADNIAKVAIEVLGAAGGATLNGSGTLAVTASMAGAGQVIANAGGVRSVTAAATGVAQVTTNATGNEAITATLAGAAAVSRMAQGNEVITASIVGAGQVLAVGSGTLPIVVSIVGAASVTSPGVSNADGTLGVAVAIAGTASVTTPSGATGNLVIGAVIIGSMESFRPVQPLSLRLLRPRQRPRMRV